MTARLQLGPQFEVIENLSIENDPQGFVLISDGLAASFEIDDAQARVGEAGFAIKEDAKFVRPAMSQQREHLPQVMLLCGLTARAIEHAGYATHGCSTPN